MGSLGHLHFDVDVGDTVLYAYRVVCHYRVIVVVFMHLSPVSDFDST